MSNEHHHISSLVTDLVEMAQATKRLPELERELREAYQRIDQLVSRSQELEGKIQQEVSLNTELAAKLHAAEVARDDAGFRQLEAEDKAAALRNAIVGVFPSLGQAIAAVENDAKDQVVRMTTAEQDEFADWKDRVAAEKARAAEEAAKPVDPSTFQPTDPAGTVGEPQAATATVTSSEDQRVTDPTGSSLEGTPSPSPELSASSSPVSYGGVSVPSDPTASQQISRSETALGSSAPEQAGARTGKYSSHRYADWPYYVSEAGWIEGGGTHESYWEGRMGFSPKTA